MFSLLEKHLIQRVSTALAYCQIEDMLWVTITSVSSLNDVLRTSSLVTWQLLACLFPVTAPLAAPSVQVTGGIDIFTISQV